MTKLMITAPLAGAILAIALPGAAQESGGFLEEVIVTAEKRETSLQDTAVAVSAFSNAELERGLITNNMDIQMAVPNMLMSKGFFTTANVSIRGIGNLAVGASADAGTGVHFNGVYLNNARIFETEYFDTQRVEVLRGPQGTLYGRNTTGGVINVITALPEDELGGNIAISYGDYEHLKIKGAVNIPLTDKLSQRFSVFYLQRDGYVDNTFDGNDIDDRDMYSVRSSTRWQITDDTDATLVINYFDEDSSRMRGSSSYCAKDPDGVLGCLPNRGKPNGSSNTAGTVGGFLTSTVGSITGLDFPADDNANTVHDNDPRKQNLDFTPAYEADETVVSLEINHDFGEYRFTSLSGYQDSSLDARNDYDFGVASEPWPVSTTTQRGPDGPFTADYLYQNDRSTTEPEQWSQEFRLSSDLDGDLNLLAGAFYLKYEGETHYYVYSSALSVYGQELESLFAIPEDQWLFDNDSSNYELETWALFGELYYDINDSTELTLGVRYTDESKEADSRSIYLDFLDDPTAEGGGYLHSKDDWQETTGKANINHHLSDEIMLYATVARSYKSGGFNPISPESALLDPDLGGDPGLVSFDPEYINSIELGAKTRWMNNRLQANLVYFYYDYEDLQVSKITNNTSINENMDADIQGFEGEFVWAPDEHWTLTANLSWLDTELGDFETFDPSDPNQMGTTENIVSLGNSNLYLDCGCPGLEVNVDGNNLPNAPEYSAFITVRYGWSLQNNMSVDLHSSYYWQDEFYTRIFNTPDDNLDEWNVWNASAVLTSANENWYAEAWVRNIEDEEIITGQHVQDAAVGLYRTYQLLEPRTYGVTLGYSF
jgi:outer membrane receptor protein involved in Fe transport